MRNIIFSLILLLVIGSTAYPANQDRSDLPIAIRQFDDPLINALYRQYRADPNVVASKDPITTYDQLPAVLQTLVKQANTKPLDLLLEACSSLLSQPVRRLEFYILFLPPAPAHIEQEKLSALLDQLDLYLNIVDPAIRDLDSFLDWYAGDDWSRRFGDTGFYYHIQQLKQNIALTRSEAAYYRAMASRNRPQAALNNIKQLTKSWNTLNEMITSLKTEAEEALILTARRCLNQARLARALAFYQESYLAEAQNALQLLLETSMPMELEYEARLEALRFAGRAYPDNPSWLRDEAEKLHQWIEANRENLPEYPQQLLELTVLQTSFAAQTEQKSLDMLKKLAQNYPRLEPTISYLVGGYHAETFNLVTDPDKLGAALDDFDLLALADYYRSQQPGDLPQTVKTFEVFLNTRPATNLHYPRILYQAGACSLQRAGNDQLAQTQDMRFQQVLAAVDCWRRLALQFPTWTSAVEPDNINAAQCASQAAALAYNLFVRDPNQYTDLALKVIPALVGDYQPDAVNFRGPFSQNESAQKFRFYYALVLQSARRYAESVEVFGTVPSDDANKTDAQILVIQLYLQLDQIDPARQMIRNDMFDRLDNPRLANLTLSLMQKQTPKLLALHAQNQKTELLSMLNESLPISQKICAATNANTALDTLSASSLSALRLYLEQLCLTAVTAADDHADPNSPWIRQAEKWFTQLNLIPSINRQLWFVRCRALYDFAAGEYRASQQQFLQVRTAAADSENPDHQYLWWEARYYGLRCLIAQGQTQQAQHALDLLLNTQPSGHPDWLNRIKQLKNAPNTFNSSRLQLHFRRQQ